MPTIIGTHEVTDADRWLGSPKRAELFPSFGGSNLRTFVNPDDRRRVALLMDVPDLNVLIAAMKNPSPEFVEAMKYDTVVPETIRFYVAS